MLVGTTGASAAAAGCWVGSGAAAMTRADGGVIGTTRSSGGKAAVDGSDTRLELRVDSSMPKRVRIDRPMRAMTASARDAPKIECCESPDRGTLLCAVVSGTTGSALMTIKLAATTSDATVCPLRATGDRGEFESGMGNVLGLRSKMDTFGILSSTRFGRSQAKLV